MQNHFKFEQKSVLTKESDFSLMKEEKLIYAELWNVVCNETTMTKYPTKKSFIFN